MAAPSWLTLLQVFESTGWYERISPDVDFDFAMKQLCRNAERQGTSSSRRTEIEGAREDVRRQLGCLRRELDVDDPLNYREVERRVWIARPDSS